MTSLAGKTLFITGSTRGIGKAIALRAAADGANVAIVGKTAEPHAKLPGTVFSTAEEIEAAGGKALACVTDVRDENQIASAVQQTLEAFGQLDILVNNASAIFLAGTLDTPAKRFDLMHSVNVRATFMASQRLPATSGEKREPSHSEPLASTKHGSTVVRSPCCLHDVEIRYEHVCARNG